MADEDYIIFFDADGKEVARVPVADVIAIIPTSELIEPPTPGDE